MGNQEYKQSDLVKVLRFFGLAVLAILANYYAPAWGKVIFHLATLVLYFKCKPEEEPFWLAYFFILADGFFGFFGLYEVTLSLLPGLPEVEVSQLYIILSIIKARNTVSSYRPFYQTPLLVLSIYLIYLIIQGYVVGVDLAMNVQFRIFKWIVPLMLLYSIPKLFQKQEQYTELFVYLFPVALVALGTQLFTILTSSSPVAFFGAKKEIWWAIEITKDKTYRGLYNESLIIASNLGALFYLAQRKSHFSNMYLFTVLIANFASIFLSATRGWTIYMVFILLSSMFFIVQFDRRRVMSVSTIILLAILASQAIPTLRIQTNNAFKRLLTLEKLAQGDATAGGTLIRITERGPRVMRKWELSKLTGWGFSREFMDNNDVHVGNQNILMQSGIIGAALMIFFIGFVSVKLWLRYLNVGFDFKYRKALLLFPIYFIGWFIIHSSSEQEFAYYQFPSTGITQAVFFGMIALTYFYAVREDNAESVVAV
ncbi:MAG TPA: hypothetical protein PK066_03000 [Saprospiraceae bacterium]|nr:hypothetical protein [Saprospiraceae bacterium]